MFNLVDAVLTAGECVREYRVGRKALMNRVYKGDIRGRKTSPDEFDKRFVWLVVREDVERYYQRREQDNGDQE